jgi:hydrogenase maturation protease
MRALIACVGNPLRGDDGFGPAVAAMIDDLPAGVRLVETGIGGVALLQELMAGWDGVILVDATDRGAAPGTVFALEPDVAEAVHVPDVHLADPDRVLSIAKALGWLPARVLLIGCQPAALELGDGLSAPVRRAVAVAISEIRSTLDAWRAEPPIVTADP